MGQVTRGRVPALLIVERKEAIQDFGFPVHVTTKSDLILRDLDNLVEINRVHASVCLTITTADDELGSMVEPGAPLPSRRFRAAKILVEHGIRVGILMMPILPFIEDSEDNIAQIITRAHECGVTCIVPWFGMSLRTGQRESFYRELDRLFPGLRQRYERQYGYQYRCACPNAQRLGQVFDEVCRRYGIATHLEHYRPHRQATQLPLC